MEDEEPMHIGGTLDVDDDTIMRPAGDATESDGTNHTGDQIETSDDEDMAADEEDNELSTSA